MQKNNSSSSCFGKIIFLLLLIVGFALYCELTFPLKLKSITPEKFESHPVRDLTAYTHNLANDTSHFYNDPLVSLCQDVEVGANNIAYCVNQKSEIIAIDTNSNKVQKLGQAQKGISYGARLSNDQALLYFVNSQLGLCQFNFKNKQVTVLVSQFEGKPLRALNSIQVNPINSSLIYLTQSNPQIPMHLHNIDILLNNPFGKLLQFNKETKTLALLTSGLYFANGIVFQKYKGQDTLLVAETNRFRMMRVYLNGQKRGNKQVAVDKLDFYLDNVKANQKGQIWIAGPSQRDEMSHFADYHPELRLIISRIPPFLFQFLINAKVFGGVKITFSEDKQTYTTDYYLWNSLPKFTFATTVTEKNNKLYISSLISKGVLVIEDLDKIKRETQTQNQVIQQVL